MSINREVISTKEGTRFRYTVRVMKNKKSRSKTATFDVDKVGQAWADKKEEELKGGLLKNSGDNLKLYEYVNAYIKTAEKARRINQSDKASLLRIAGQGSELGELREREITAEKIVRFAERRLKGTATLSNTKGKKPNGVSPSTNNTELSKLTAALNRQAVCQIPFNIDWLDEAWVIMRFKRLVSASKVRMIRIDNDKFIEIYKVLYDTYTKSPIHCPYHLMFVLSVYTTMRLSEICSITWDDYHPDQKMLVVRERKHPNATKKVTSKIPLCKESIEIIEHWRDELRWLTKDTKGLIFPFNTASISSRFNSIQKEKLGVENPEESFHLARHEGISRLFEMGKTIPQVAEYSGHKTWQSLKVYAAEIVEKKPFPLWQTCRKLHD